VEKLQVTQQPALLIPQLYFMGVLNLVSCNGNGSAMAASRRGPGGAAGRGDPGTKGRIVVLRNRYGPPKIVNDGRLSSRRYYHSSHPGLFLNSVHVLGNESYLTLI
jgi:hypothetical protein